MLELDRAAVHREAQRLWHSTPIIALAYGTLAAFVEARTIEAIERCGGGAPEAARRDRHRRQSDDAAARLALVRGPLSAEPAGLHYDIASEQLVVWVYGRFDDVRHLGRFNDNALRDAIAAAPDATEIVLRISSCGGFVDVLDRMLAVLATFAGRSIAIIDTAATSSGARLALACDHVVARSNSTLMLHRVHRCLEGNALELRRIADELDQIDARLNEALYAKRPGVDRERLRDAIDYERYLDPVEAMSMGLVDEIIEPLVFPTGEVRA